MDHDKRKFLRLECMLPAEVTKIGEQGGLTERARVDDFSRGGLKLVIDLDFDFVPGTKVELLCPPPEEAEAIPAKAEVVWSRNEGGTWSLGLKVLDITPEARSELIDSCYAQWREKKVKV